MRLSACSAFGLLLSSAMAMAQTAVPVTVAQPSSTSVRAEVRLTGTVTAEKSARLSARVDGLVVRVLVDAGDQVEAGAVLLELDDALAALALERARAQSAQFQAEVDEAERLLREAARLAESRSIAATEVANREAALVLSQAALAAATAAQREQAELVRRHVLTAPFAGIVTDRLTEVGEWVSRGTAVLNLVALDRLRIDLQAPQERFDDIREGAAVAIISDARPGIGLTGRVQAKLPVSDPSSRSFLVRVLIDDAEAALLPGTSAQARIRQPEADRPALLIPTDALLRYPDGSHGLFIVAQENGQLLARARKVAIGRDAEDRVEILDGLRLDESVVVRGNEALRDGQAVRIAEVD